MAIFQHMSKEEARELYNKTKQAKEDFMATHDIKTNREWFNQVGFMNNILDDLYFFTENFSHDY